MMRNKSTATALRRSVNRLNKLHEQITEAREQLSDALMARYHITLDEASDFDYDTIIEIAYYGGSTLYLKELDEEMKRHGHTVTKTVKGLDEKK